MLQRREITHIRLDLMTGKINFFKHIFNEQNVVPLRVTMICYNNSLNVFGVKGVTV